MMRRAILFVASLLLLWIGAAMAAQAQAFPGDQESPWRRIDRPGSAPSIPIRLVGQDEPWEQVVQDIQAHLKPRAAGRAVRVGFYGHGAFVKPKEILNALPFVAALGEAATLDVMVFPHWRFPE